MGLELPTEQADKVQLLTSLDRLGTRRHDDIDIGRLFGWLESEERRIGRDFSVQRETVDTRWAQGHLQIIAGLLGHVESAGTVLRRIRRPG